MTDLPALTLWQPWASLIAIGVKRYETRSWPAPERLIGQRIAIHAAKRPVAPDNREWARRYGAADLPLGAVLCTATIAGAYQCGATHGRHAAIIDSVPGSLRLAPPALTRAGIAIDEFGDYSHDRWVWLLTDTRKLRKPAPARGAQGIWRWHG